MLTELLGSLIGRCERLKIIAPMQHIMRLDACCLPSLKDVTIIASDLLTRSDAITDDFSFLKYASSLRYATLGGIIDLCPIPSLPFANLEMLCLHPRSMSFTPNHAMEILSRCHNLRACSLHFGVPFDATSLLNTQYRGDPITIPLLEDLYISADRYILITFLGKLVLPKLRDLHINESSLAHGDQIVQQRLYPVLSSLLVLSACTLQSFTLKALGTTQDDLLACLSLIPSIVSLDIMDSDGIIDDAFIRRLVRTESEQCLCPKLTRIRLDQYLHLSWDSVADFLHSRSRGTESEPEARLTFVDIIFHYDPNYSPAVWHIIDALRSEGMNIRIDSLFG